MNNEFLKPKETPVTYILVGINILVFVIFEIMGSTEDITFMMAHGAMNPYLIVHMGQWYRLFTCMFLHFGIRHLFNNMLLLFLLGQIFERAVGSTRFGGIYLGSGLAGSFLSFFSMCLVDSENVVAGASGAIFGIVGGMIVVILLHKGNYAGISLKRMILMALLTLYLGFSSAGTDNVGHIGGILAGAIFTFIFYGVPLLISRHKR